MAQFFYFFRKKSHYYGIQTWIIRRIDGDHADQWTILAVALSVYAENSMVQPLHPRQRYQRSSVISTAGRGTI